MKISNAKNFCRQIFVAFFAVAIFFSGVNLAQATGPFGGPVLTIIPCLSPFTGFYIEIGPPTPMSLVYIAGSTLSYSFGPPAYVGQWLLGMSGGPSSCATERHHGQWTSWYGGDLIIFHGSSGTAAESAAFTSAGVGVVAAGAAGAGAAGLASGSGQSGQSNNQSGGSGSTSSSNPSNQTGQNPAPATYSGRIVITKGGTYSGNWESNDSRYPAVEIRTSEPVVIQNSNIRSKGHLIYSNGYNADITVKNTRGYGENPDVNMQVPGRFLYTQSFSRVVIQNDYMEGTRGIDIHGPKRGAGTIIVTNNQVKNIDGRLSAGNGKWQSGDVEDYSNSSSIDVGDLYGQFIQLNQIFGAHTEIAWNEIINQPYVSRSEDVISVYKSFGSQADPIGIHDNYIQGSYPHDPTKDQFSGGGIMAADDVGSSNVLVAGNTVVSTSNYGISASAGVNIKIDNNRIISSGILSDGKRMKYDPNAGNVGLSIFKGYGVSLVNVDATRNTIGWAKPNGERNDWWVPEADNFSGNKHFSGGSIGQNDPVTPDTEAAEYSLWQKKLATNGVTVGIIGD